MKAITSAPLAQYNDQVRRLNEATAGFQQDTAIRGVLQPARPGVTMPAPFQDHRRTDSAFLNASVQRCTAVESAAAGEVNEVIGQLVDLRDKSRPAEAESLRRRAILVLVGVAIVMLAFLIVVLR